MPPALPTIPYGLPVCSWPVLLAVPMPTYLLGLLCSEPLGWTGQDRDWFCSHLEEEGETWAVCMPGLCNIPHHLPNFILTQCVALASYHPVYVEPCLPTAYATVSVWLFGCVCVPVPCVPSLCAMPPAPDPLPSLPCPIPRQLSLLLLPYMTL